MNRVNSNGVDVTDILKYCPTDLMKKMDKEGQDTLNNCSKRNAIMQPYKEDKQRALQM